MKALPTHRKQKGAVLILVTVALFTLLGYVEVDAVVFACGLYYLTRVVCQGMLPESGGDSGEAHHAKRPFSAANARFDDDAAPTWRQ